MSECSENFFRNKGLCLTWHCEKMCSNYGVSERSGELKKWPNFNFFRGEWQQENHPAEGFRRSYSWRKMSDWALMTIFNDSWNDMAIFGSSTSKLITNKWKYFSHKRFWTLVKINICVQSPLNFDGGVPLLQYRRPKDDEGANADLCFYENSRRRHHNSTRILNEDVKWEPARN